MKFALTSLNHLVLAGLLATAGASAMAQGAPAAPPAPAGKMAAMHGGDHAMMERHDPAQMQARMAKHQAELKAKLKITASQEAAWTAWTAAMQPPAHMGQRPTPEQQAEFAKLTTPERIDKMHALHSERMAEMTAAMNKHGDATKTFYAALNAEQKKTFDAEFAKFAQHEGRGHREGRGGPDGHEGGMRPKN